MAFQRGEWRRRRDGKFIGSAIIDLLVDLKVRGFVSLVDGHSLGFDLLILILKPHLVGHFNSVIFFQNSTCSFPIKACKLKLASVVSNIKIENSFWFSV